MANSADQVTDLKHEVQVNDLPFNQTVSSTKAIANESSQEQNDESIGYKFNKNF